MAVVPLTGCDAVRAEVSKYPDWDVNVMTAISHAESHCRPEARGDGHLTYTNNGRVYGYSLSVMQVRILPGREHCDSNNLEINVKCAYSIWKGQGYTAWTQFSNNSYLKFM